MFSKTRIVRTLSTGLVVISLGAGLIGGAGVAHGQPVAPNGSSCTKLSENVEPGIDTYADGSVATFYPGGKKICVNGAWVSCGDATLTPTQRTACGTGLSSGGRSFGTLNTSGTFTSTGTTSTFQPISTTTTFTFTR